MPVEDGLCDPRASLLQSLAENLASTVSSYQKTMSPANMWPQDLCQLLGHKLLGSQIALQRRRCQRPFGLRADGRQATPMQGSPIKTAFPQTTQESFHAIPATEHNPIKLRHVCPDRLQVP